VLIFSKERIVPSEQTERMKLTVAYRNFEKVPNSYNMHVP